MSIPDDRIEKIHKAAEQFSEVIGQVLGEGSRQAVFYAIVQDDLIHSGFGGNMGHLERLGAIELMKKCEMDSGTDDQLL